MFELYYLKLTKIIFLLFINEINEKNYINANHTDDEPRGRLTKLTF